MASARKQILSIRRVVAGVLVMLCVGINVLAAIYVLYEHRLVEDTITAMAEERMNVWADLCGPPLAEGDDEALQALVDAIAQSRGTLFVSVRGRSGLVRAASDPSWIGTSSPYVDDSRPDVQELYPRPSGLFHESGHMFRYRSSIERDGQVLGTLTVRLNTTWGNQKAKAMAYQVLLLVFVFTLAIGGLAVALDWRLRRAVRSLIDATQAIARGERRPAIRVGTGDDLDVLGASVQQIADALDDADRKVHHWTRELEASIAHRNKQLQQSEKLLAGREKMAALGLMAAGIVHEVGNPLAAIATIVQRMELDAEPKLRGKCQTLRHQVDRMMKILAEIRQVARPTATDASGADLNRAIDLALKVCQYDRRIRQVQVVRQLGSELPLVRGHPDRWQQVFLNLMINALDAMPHGGELLVATQVANGSVLATVRDTGIGMTSAQLQNLYHPFYTTKKTGGMGLGLSVCHAIVRSYGADISVRSEIGCGSEFLIVAPVQARTAARPAKQSTERIAIPSPPSGSPAGVRPHEKLADGS